MCTFSYVYRCGTSCEQPSHWPMSTMLGRVALRAIILTFDNLYTTCTYEHISITVDIHYYKVSLLAPLLLALPLSHLFYIHLTQ